VAVIGQPLPLFAVSRLEAGYIQVTCFILWAGTWEKPASVAKWAQSLPRLSQGASLPAMPMMTGQGDHFPSVDTRFM
jgi:hypothetical protein